MDLLFYSFPIFFFIKLDELLSELRLKQRQLDRVSSTEHELKVELAAIRDNLSSNNRELTQKTSEVRSLDFSNLRFSMSLFLKVFFFK